MEQFRNIFIFWHITQQWEKYNFMSREKEDYNIESLIVFIYKISDI